MMTEHRRISSREKVWVREFAPTVAGLTPTWPAWTLYVLAHMYNLAAEAVTFEANGQYTQTIFLYLSPHAEDGYLHLDLVPQDGAHDATMPDPWPLIGAVLLLWGNLTAGATEPRLHVLKHVETEAEA